MASEGYRHGRARQKSDAGKPDIQATPPEFLSTGEVADLAQSLTGKRPSPSTITRWMLRGARGQRLPARRIGGRLYAPRKAALEWLGGFGRIGDEPGNGEADSTVSSLLGRAWGSASSTPTNGRRQGGAA